MTGFVFACGSNSNKFEDDFIRIDDLRGLKLEKKNIGTSSSSSVETASHYLIYKDAIGTPHNYVMIQAFERNGKSTDEYLQEDFGFNSEQFPAFEIQDDLRDTVVNGYKGSYYSISVHLGDKKMIQGRFALESPKGKGCDIRMNLIDDDGFKAAKEDFDSIISHIVLK